MTKYYDRKIAKLWDEIHRLDNEMAPSRKSNNIESNNRDNNKKYIAMNNINKDISLRCPFPKPKQFLLISLVFMMLLFLSYLSLPSLTGNPLTGNVVDDLVIKVNDEVKPDRGITIDPTEDQPVITQESRIEEFRESVENTEQVKGVRFMGDFAGEKLEIFKMRDSQDSIEEEALEEEYEMTGDGELDWTYEFTDEDPDVVKFLFRIEGKLTSSRKRLIKAEDESDSNAVSIANEVRKRAQEIIGNLPLPIKKEIEADEDNVLSSRVSQSSKSSISTKQRQPAEKRQIVVYADAFSKKTSEDIIDERIDDGTDKEIDSSLGEEGEESQEFFESSTSTVQAVLLSKVVVGEPVKWSQKSKVENNRVMLQHAPINVTMFSGGNEISDSDVQIVVDKQVKDLDQYEDEKRIELLNSKIKLYSDDELDVAELEKESRRLSREAAIANLGRTFRKLISAEITGNLVLDHFDKNDVVLMLDKMEEEVAEVEITYFTEGPVIYEEGISDGTRNGKRIVVSSEIHYKDILAYTYIEDSDPDDITLYHLDYINSEEDNAKDNIISEYNVIKEQVLFDGYDTNNDNLVDYIEWRVPHLSNESYEVIIDNTTYYAEGGNVTMHGNYSHLNVSADPPYNSLVGYWSFDADRENTELTMHYDFSVEENSGVGVGNAVVNETDCIYWNCLQLDGDGDYVSVVDDDSLDLDATDGSVCLWVKQNSVSGTLNPWITKAYADNQYYIDYYSGNIRWYMGSSSLETYSFLSSFDWTHFCMTTNSTASYLYVNGSLMDSGSTSPFVNRFSGVYIGSRSSGSAQYHYGSIDEVMIFNSSLTQVQISAIYNNQSPRFPALGTQDIKQINISSGNDAIKARLDRYSRMLGSNISLGIGQWDVSLGYNETDFPGYNELVAYYHFDGESWAGAGTYDVVDSMGRANLSAQGGVSNIQKDYPFYKVAVLDGVDDYFLDQTSAGPGAINGGDNGTMSAWVKRLGSSTGYEPVVVEGGGSSGYFIYTNCNDNNVQFGVRSSTSNVYTAETSNSLVADGEWHHIAGVYDGDANMVYLYIDGELQTSAAADTDVGNPVNGIDVGGQTTNHACDRSTTDGFFNGSIDEVMIWNRTLTGMELKEVYVKGRAKWNYTAYQNITARNSNDNSSQNQYNISNSTTNILPSFRLYSGTYSFFTPLVLASVEFPLVLNSSSLYLHPDDANTSQYVASGSIDGTLTEGRAYAANQDVSFAHPDHGRRLRITASFSDSPVDLSNLVILASDRKTAVDLSSVTGIDSAHTLYLPRHHHSGAFVCPDATSLGDVSPSCSNIVKFTADEIASGETKNGITVSIDSGQIKFANVAGSGASEDSINPNISFVEKTPENDTGINEDYLLVNVSTSDDSQHYTFSDFDNDLLLWVRMDDVNDTGLGAGVYDNSSYAGEMQAYGDAIQTIDGYYGYGYKFNSSGDYLQLPEANHLDFYDDSSYTWSMWVRWNNTGKSHWILTKRPTGTTGGYVIKVSNQDMIEFGIYSTKKADNVNEIMISEALSTETWYHVAITYNTESDIKMFINGSEVNSTSSDLSNDTSSPIRLSSTLANYWFNGTIDDVMIFNRTLSSDEMLALYNASAYQYLRNFTGISNGNYTYKAYTVDIAGNFNMTEERGVIIDSVIPYLQYANGTPANGSVTYHNFTIVNVSSSDNNGQHFALVDLDNDLALWLRMDNTNQSGTGAKIFDNSTHGNDGVAFNQAEQTPSGYWGEGYRFDGSGDYIRIGNAYELGALPELSFSFWIRPGAGNTANYNTILEKYDDDYGVYLNSNVYPVFYTSGLSPSDVESNYPLVTGTWHHVVVTYNSSIVNIYVNGELNKSQSVTGSLVDNENDFFIGGNTADSDFNGTLDEIMVFNRVLNQSEIHSLYNASAYQYYSNLTISSAGMHNFTAYAVDRGGNVNKTLERFIIVDHSGPIISFANPTPDNDSYKDEDNIFVNISSYDASDHYAFADFESDLIFWLRMDNVNQTGLGSKIYDNSSYMRNATAQGDAVQASGFWGDSYEFDGSNDWILIEHPEILDFTDNRTVSLWFRSESDGTLMARTEADDASGNGDMRIDISSSKIYPTFSDECYGFGTADVDDGKWHNVVWIYNGTYFIVYLDGQLDASIACSVSSTNDYNVTLGMRQYRESSELVLVAPLQGNIDEILIFNRSLSYEEALSLYNATANQFENNYTSKTDGNYSFYAYAVDRPGSLSATGERKVTVDTIKPNVSFVSPTHPDEYITPLDSIYVNLSSNDTNSHYSFVDFNNSLLLWMTMDDINASGNPTDLSTYGNNGSKESGAFRTPSGFYGKGFEFDGSNDRIVVPYDTMFNFSVKNEASWGAWVRRKGAGSSSTEVVFSSGYSRWSLNLRHTDGMSMACALNNGSWHRAYYNPGYDYTGEWHHILCSWNGSNISFYYDGQYVNSTTCYNVNVLASDLTIGSGGPSFYFNGTVDEVMFLDRVLGADEIAALYNATVSQYEHNFTSLSQGAYTVKGYTVDRAGNRNQTAQRQITIDTNPPELSFADPTPENVSYLNENHIYINLSSSDASDHYSFISYDDDLVLWMRMDDVNSSGSGADVKVYDNSSFGNNATGFGNAAQTDSGYFGKGFSFDGVGDNITIPDATSLGYSAVSKMSWSFWIYPKTASSGIIRKGTWSVCAASGGYSIYINSTSDLVFSDCENPSTVGSTSSLKLNSWHHIGITQSSATLKIYVNGVLNSSGSVGSSDESNDLVIGAAILSGGSTIYHFNGTIDELIMFNRTLNASEIQALYTAGSYQYNNNFTDSSFGADGSHYFQGYAADKAGYVATTNPRNITIDTINPNISFVDPTLPDNNITNQSSIYINISANDTNVHYSFADFNNDLVLWMRFDHASSAGEGATVYGNSSYRHNATAFGNAVQNQSGRFGESYTFDSSGDYLNVNLTADLNTTNETNWTWSAWVRPVDLAETLQIIMTNQRTTGDPKGGVRMWQFRDTFIFKATANTGAGTFAQALSTVVVPNKWYHVVGVYNGTHPIIYVNGTKKGVGNPVELSHTDINYTISSSSDPYPGNIDEIMIFNRALSQDEIQSLYNSTAYQYEHNFSGLTDDNYSVTGYAVDRAGNVNKTEERNIVTDTIAPVITLLSPANNTNTTNTSINFNWTSSDLTNITLNCTLIIDGVDNASLATNISQSRNYTINFTQLGYHNWSVRCNDTYWSNTSEVWDLYIIEAPENISIDILPNMSVVLNWSNLTYADSYEVYFSATYNGAFTQLASGLSMLNYTDGAAGFVGQRYYKVSTNRGGVVQNSSVLGKITYNLTGTWNMVSFPFNLSIWTPTNGTENSNSGRELEISPAGCLDKIYRYNASNSSFDALKYSFDYEGWIPLAGSENFTLLEASRGYFFLKNTTCNSYNFTFAGFVPTNNLTIYLPNGWSLGSWHSQRNDTFGQNDNPININDTPSDTLWLMQRWDPVNEQWEEAEYFYVEGVWEGWWNWDTDFTYLSPPYGYWFRVKKNCEWYHEP